MLLYQHDKVRADTTCPHCLEAKQPGLVLCSPASWGTLHVPAGAEVHFISALGGGYALRSPKKYGMNDHDAKYRYAWVPADAVDKEG